MSSMKNFYKDFDLIDETPLPDYNGRGIYLKHRTTGLEIFHVANSDEENLFGFVFRTPYGNSTGAAHITEHSVFCGSEKFPLKEPFVNLMNQSMNTFLNAMTYPDKTIYPAASMNRADYFNLMDVYADAVFFPLMSRETFMQEGHRLELGEDGEVSIQGVVYNEMKGAYSSFGSVAGDFILRSLQGGTVYEYDSGGDPLVIPEFSYDEFKSFHEKFYKPDNALLFLYGNIDTKEQIDFIEEKFLRRLEKKYGAVKGVAKNVFADTKQFVPEKNDAPVVVREAGPDSGAHGSYVSVNWRLGLTSDLQSLMEVFFIMQVLAGNDASPVSKALLESGCGDGLINDMDSSFYTTSVSFGLMGVKDGCEQKIADIVTDVLKNIAAEGVPEENVEAAVLTLDFSNREVTRGHGPYSLKLLSRTATGWNYGAHPALMLGYREAFEKIKETLLKDKNYVQKLVQKFFIDNNAKSFVTVYPSSKFNEERVAQEKVIASKIAEKLGDAEIKTLQKKFEAYQQKEDSAEDASCIPHVQPKDISPERPPLITERDVYDDGSPVQIFYNDEPTNGIVYVDVLFPVDCLPPEEYFYMPLLSACLFNTGWSGKNWAECLTLAGLCTGDMSSMLSTAELRKSERAKTAIEKESGTNIIGRDWLVCRIKAPVEKADAALRLFVQALTEADFVDGARIKNIVDDFYNGARESVVPGANKFMNSRTARRITHSSAVGEIWHGLSQIYALEKISSEKPDVLGKHFAALFKSIKDAGAVMHVTADGQSLNEVKPLVKKFIEQAKLHAVLPCEKYSDEKFFELTDLRCWREDLREETLRCDARVGCASVCIPLGEITTEDAAALEVLAHYLSANGLWTRIRTTGGAYGASADVSRHARYFRMSTYRDPTPERSLEQFVLCLKDACEMDLSIEEVERAVTGTYGDLVQPLSPAGRGFLGLQRILYAETEADLLDLRKAVLAVSENDIKRVAKKIIDNLPNQRAAKMIEKKDAAPANAIDFDL